MDGWADDTVHAVRLDLEGHPVRREDEWRSLPDHPAKIKTHLEAGGRVAYLKSDPNGSGDDVLIEQVEPEGYGDWIDGEGGMAEAEAEAEFEDSLADLNPHEVTSGAIESVLIGVREGMKHGRFSMATAMLDEYIEEFPEAARLAPRTPAERMLARLQARLDAGHQIAAAELADLIGMAEDEHAAVHRDPAFTQDGRPRGLLSSADWLEEVEPVEWRVTYPWAPAGSLALLTGRGGSGKTKLAVQLAMAVASGSSEVMPVAHDDSLAPQLPVDAKPATAVYLGWETSRKAAQRARESVAVCGGPVLDRIGNRFLFLPTGELGFGPLWAPDPDGSGHVSSRARPTPNAEKLLDWLRAIPDLKLLVIDPLASAYASNEIDRSMSRPFLDWLAAFATTHPAEPLVLMIAHPPKGRNGHAPASYSGNSDWRNGVKSLWVVETATAPGRKKPGPGETASYRRLRLDKANEAYEGLAIPLSSVRKELDGKKHWRWSEARNIDDANENYAEVHGDVPASEKGDDEPKPISKTQKAKLYAEERLVDDANAFPPSLADVEADYEAWHDRNFEEECDGLLKKRSFNRAMNAAGRAARIGGTKGRDTLNHARLRTPVGDEK